MSDSDQQDKSSKTEEPTAKRIEDARQRGQFAKTQDLQVVFVLAATLIVMLFAAEKASREVVEISAHILGNLEKYVPTPDTVLGWMRGSLYFYLKLVLPMALAAAAAAIVAGGLQSGFRLTPKAFGWQPGKLNPIKGFKEKYSTRAWVRTGMDLLKFAAIGGVICFGVRRVTGDPIFHSRVPPGRIGAFILETTLFLLFLLILSLGAIAVCNYLYQRHKTHQDLRMSLKEVRDERKQQEGDPLIRSAQRRMARRLAEKQMFAAVPTADLILTNPTHFAVAIRYNRGSDPAPVVLAKGKNLIAAKIRRLAGEHGVPIVENKPLARALYRFGEVGRPIPTQLYQVVAEVLAYVYRTHRYYFYQRNRKAGGVA